VNGATERRREEAMRMKYALLIYGRESAWQSMPEDELNAVYQQYEDFGKWIADQGWARGGEELASTSSATCVRLEDGRTVTTDGPYAETKEQLGGFYLIECENLDQAIDAASRIPGIDRGTIEVRPVVEH
jgi:hypothetical protein